MKYDSLLLAAMLGGSGIVEGCAASHGSSPLLPPAKAAAMATNVESTPNLRTRRLDLIDNGLNELAEYPRTGADVSFGSPAVVLGSNTELSDPFGVATNGKIIVVANAAMSMSQDVLHPFATLAPHVLVFKSGTSGGNIAPAREITGAKTLLQAPLGAAVDAAGDIFIADSPASAIFKFAPGANGNVYPIAIITGTNTTLRNPTRVTLDGAGDIWVSNGGGASILEFLPGDNGDVVPFDEISGSHTHLNGVAGIAVSKTGEIFATNYLTNEVLEFAPGSSGDATPTDIISGSATQLNYPTGITIDVGDSELLVASHFANQVNAYKMNANGNAAPVSVLSDSNTQGVIDVSYH